MEFQKKGGDYNNIQLLYILYVLLLYWVTFKLKLEGKYDFMLMFPSSMLVSLFCEMKFMTIPFSTKARNKISTKAWYIDGNKVHRRKTC